MISRAADAAATFYAALGGASLVSPARVPVVFRGTAPTPESRTEVRAVYGGLPLAVALLVVAGPASPSAEGRRQAAAGISLGTGAGRLAGAALERTFRPWPTGFFLLAEGALALVLAA